MKKYTQIMGWVVQAVGVLNACVGLGFFDDNWVNNTDFYFVNGFIIFGIGVLVTAFGCSMVKEST